MKTRFTILAVAALLTVVTGGAIAGAGDNPNFVAVLSGDEEVPPVGTHAAGLAKYQLNKSGDQLSFKLIVANIDDVTQAHIHCGPAGVNGPVIAFLYGFGPTVTSNGILSEGSISNANVIVRPDSSACPGGVSDFDDVLAKMESGDAYTNVHTTAFPGGEIRGQIRARSAGLAQYN
jgi:hypothetical protein